MTQPAFPLSHKAGSLRSRLANWLGISPASPDLLDAVAGLRADIAVLNQAVTEEQSHLARLQEQLDRLEKQQSRTGKEQYKANLLSEAQQQSVKAILEQLKESEAYRERELDALRERLVGARGAGLLEVAQQLFPVLDGLEEAIASGQRLLGQAKPASVAPPTLAVHRSLFQRLFSSPVSPASSPRTAIPTDDKPWETWLKGLELIHARLLDVLSAQGINPMETEGEIFDPRWHLAVEAVPASDGQSSGQIVKTQRRGYLRGETVLRYAEVVVAR